MKRNWREKHYKARSRKARDWARLVSFVLIALTIVAVISDRTTGPAAQAHVITWIDGLEAIRQMLIENYPRFFA